MASVEHLSPAHCVLLAAHHAANSNIDALRCLSQARPDAFALETPLRILLTFLPESAAPPTYTAYVHDVSLCLNTHTLPVTEVDVAPVKHISARQALKRVQRLDLVPLAHASCTDDDLDPLVLFVIHRAYRIDAETGLLPLVPALVDPFLDRSPRLRAWFISIVLPLLRLDFEYYPEEASGISLETFSAMSGLQGVDTLLQNSNHPAHAPSSSSFTSVARDLRGLVGPWMFGFADHLPTASKNNHDWEHVFAWLVRQAPQRFDLVCSVVEHWHGPADADLGGYDDPKGQPGLDAQLNRRYAQAVFASVYSVESDGMSTIEAAHAVLVRLAEMMRFPPPAGLTTNVDMLPKLVSQTSILCQATPPSLQSNTFLTPENPLTVPGVETFYLLEILVHSASILADIGHAVSLNSLAKFRFHSDEDDQLHLIRKILKGLGGLLGAHEGRWRTARDQLIWLWSWGADLADEQTTGSLGIFGKVARCMLEKEILTSILAAGQPALAVRIYLPERGRCDHLETQGVEECVLGQVMRYYDNASNGNVTRGGMKRALHIMTTFKPHFSKSPAFVSAEALLAATHALSFYSLTLQHGVPFQPVNIRISDDPISLIAKVLGQNPGCHSKLDDLITIGQHLVVARELERDARPMHECEAELEAKKKFASRRVTGMAIEAALAEDDFETAYSFVVNRLSPSVAGGDAKQQTDDIVWRAAYLAGRYRSSTDALASSSRGSVAGGSSHLRRLDQRMELLSQALLLAPASSVPEVLTAWRRCEEEMTAALARETAQEELFDDHAARKAPGAFPAPAEYAQARWEIGRSVCEEPPPMGLFDVARGAAAAFSKTAFPLRAGAAAAASTGQHADDGPAADDATRNLSVASSDPSSGDEGKRVRKRDMVANAVTGGLASGIGWVLGATPVVDSEQQSEQPSRSR